VAKAAFEPSRCSETVNVRPFAAAEPSAAEPGLGAGQGPHAEALVESYRRLAEVFHHVLSEQGLSTLLERIANTLADLVPYDSLSIYQADEPNRLLVPVFARDKWADKILNTNSKFGEGITGWAVEHRQPVLTNRAHLDPRVKVIPGTPADEPEALISVPLIARGSLKGALNIYRLGEEACFVEEEFELAKWFGDAAALALDNAQVRARLEFQAQTDSLTGLYNHRYFHERLRAELTRASRTRDSVAVLMLDIDDFKRVNDVHGHGCGDSVLTELAEVLSSTVRASDVVCRLGGEEFGVVMASCNARDALGLAQRLTDRLARRDLEPSAGRITVSIGISQGPDHAMNPRELVACAEAAMMTAKARGKNQVVVFDDGNTERPDEAASTDRDVRSIAHLKMLQSLAGKLNRLNSVRHIGEVIAEELRMLIDYHNCRVYVADGNRLVPVAFRGELDTVDRDLEPPAVKFGEGVTGRAAQLAESVLVPNALDCEFAVQIPGTQEIEESMLATPLRFGSRVIGVVVLSSLGTHQFDEDDVRLLEVLAGQASVALENARLYEAQRQEAEDLKALLEFGKAISKAPTFQEIGDETARAAARLLGARQSALWLKTEEGEFRPVAHVGYVGDREGDRLIEMPIGPDQAEQFLRGRREPFLITAEAAREILPSGPDVVWRTAAIAPLGEGEGVQGWITVREPWAGGDHLTEARLRLLAGLSDQASVALQKARLYRNEKDSAETARALLEFSRELAEAEGLPEVLERLVELTAKTVGSPRTSIWLPGETGELQAAALWGYDDGDRERITDLRFETGMVGERSEPFLFHEEDLARIEGAPAEFSSPTFAVAPLGLEGGRTGYIVAAVPEQGEAAFTEQPVRLLAGIASQAKLAIANAGSFENLERTFLSTVEALANALEANDEYTSTHARSITDLSLWVGAGLGLDPRGMKRLELGALLHDIGKIGIPANILSKPGPLTEHERGVIELHPELGEKILAPIDRLAEVRPIVRHCHERWDGEGYPDGKTGEEIPIESRIIFVCDAFHAMTTDRPYRKRLSVAEACRRLEESAGSQFDPGIVEVFLSLLREQPRWPGSPAGPMVADLDSLATRV
jgi:diguanylate cyclase (GGDEF)-like protein